MHEQEWQGAESDVQSSDGSSSDEDSSGSGSEGCESDSEDENTSDSDEGPLHADSQNGLKLRTGGCEGLHVFSLSYSCAQRDHSGQGRETAGAIASERRSRSFG